MARTIAPPPRYADGHDAVLRDDSRRSGPATGCVADPGPSPPGTAHRQLILAFGPFRGHVGLSVAERGRDRAGAYSSGFDVRGSEFGVCYDFVFPPSWACSAVGSAPEWHSGGHQFDPGQVHHLSSPAIVSELRVARHPSCSAESRVLRYGARPIPDVYQGPVSGREQLLATSGIGSPNTSLVHAMPSLNVFTENEPFAP